MKPGVPAGLPCISLPLSPADRATRPGTTSSPRRAPLAGQPGARRRRARARIIYTSGTTGMPKGVMHSFGTFAWSIDAGLQARRRSTSNARMLSYLPLAHVVERTLVEHGLLATGMHVYFAESSTTFAADLQRARPTVFFSVPRLWVKFQQGVHAKMPAAEARPAAEACRSSRHRAQEDPQGARPRPVHFAAGGAAPMPPELLRWYRRLGPGHRRGLRHDRELRRLALPRCPASRGLAPSACPTTACSAASTRRPARSR